MHHGDAFNPSLTENGRVSVSAIVQCRISEDGIERKGKTVEN